DKYELAALEPGWAWLVAHQPRQRDAGRILHLDFHPINLILGPKGQLSLLDWTEADIGDPHADVATTLMLLECVPVELTSVTDRLLVRVGRFFLRRWYLRAYRWQRPLDASKLAYYRAWAAFRRLCTYGAWLSEGPRVTGSKPSSLRHLTPQ